VYKIKRILSIVLSFSFIFIVSPKASANSNIYNDVAPATTDVVFRITLDKSVPYIGANIAHAAGSTGSGQYVVVIDTGVESAHPALAGRVALEACFAPRCPNGLKSQIGPGAARPVHYHGTHVAGIVAASSPTIKGVAPGANIIAVNVFDPYGAAYDDDIIAALKWVDSISSQYNIASINMSLGSSRVFRTTCDGYIPEMTNVIRSLRDKNIATVISSGNSYAVGMSAPACISFAVSVAATEVNSDAVTDFSNISESTTLAAPGRNIVSLNLMGSTRSASGTSMAAPHVAGAWAVYNSKFGKQSVSKVVSDFTFNAPLATDSYSGIKIPRLSFNNLFSGNPIPAPSTTTTTTVPSSSTTIPSSSTTIPTTTIVPSPTTTVVIPPFHPTITRPILLDIYGGFTSFVYVKYRVPVVGRDLIKHYNLYCTGVNGNSTYQIPHQSRWRIDNYKLNVPASQIDYCTMTAVSIYDKETQPSNRANIFPRNRR
jgi:subtilisin family serine protease